MKTEAKDGGTEGIVKKETLELSISNHGNSFHIIPEVVSIKEEEADVKDFLCKTLGYFRVQSGAQ